MALRTGIVLSNEDMKHETDERMKAEDYRVDQTANCAAQKVPRQCPIVLLIEVIWRIHKAWKVKRVEWPEVDFLHAAAETG
jgi:hypothetical protein